MQCPPHLIEPPESSPPSGSGTFGVRGEALPRHRVPDPGHGRPIPAFRLASKAPNP